MSLWILNDKNEISITKARLQLSWVYRVWVAVIILLFFIPTRRTDSVKCPGWRTIQLSQLRWALPLSSVDSLDPLCSSWAHLKLVLGHLYLAVAGSRWPIWWTRLVLLFFENDAWTWSNILRIAVTWLLSGCTNPGRPIWIVLLFGSQTWTKVWSIYS